MPNNLQKIIEENEREFDKEFGWGVASIVNSSKENPTSIRDIKEVKARIKLHDLRLIEWFREMVREKSSKYGSDNEIDAVSVDLLSELGSINENSNPLTNKN